MNEELRQTGRTTRMIEEACQRAAEGHAVYVVVHDDRYQKAVQRQVDELWFRRRGDHHHGIKVETLKSLGPDWNWEKLSMLRAHPNCRFFVDHALLELKVRQLHREIAARAALIGMLYPKTV